MHYLYILYSPSSNKYYVGSTSDLVARLKKHNTNHKGFTGRATDWNVAYTERFSEKPEAVTKNSTYSLPV